MSIQAELEHANLIPISKSALTDEMIQQLSQESKVLMICGVAKGPDEQTRREYVKALVKAEIITTEQVEEVLEDESLVIVVPFHSLYVAEDTYRRIPHASHFVKIYLDGEPYAGDCS